MIEEKIQRFYYKKSRLQQFRGFCYLVQLGTMEKAGEKVGLGKAAISLQIKALEDDLKLKLFDRNSNHKLKPTLAGMRLYEKLIPLVNSANGIVEEFLEEESEDRKNTLNIAGHHIVLSNILPKYLAALKHSEEFKNVKFKLFNIPKHEAYEKTISGEVDIMFYPVENKEKIPTELELTKVLKYQPVFVLHKGHFLTKKEARDITVQDLKKTDFILIDHFSVSSTMDHLIEDHKIGYDDIMFKNGNWNFLKAL